MPIWPNVYGEIIKKPYEQGREHLRVLTGYASSAFVHHLLYTYDRLKIDLILGMAKKDAIAIWDHNEYIKLVAKTGRLRVRYFNNTPPIHSKVILWTGKDGKIDLAYVGSSNFTWNGFRDYQEIMVSADPTEAAKAFPADETLKDCTDDDIFEHFNMRYQREANESDIDTAYLGSIAGEYPSVELKLTQRRDNQVHMRSGLNWGQREGREPNQAYIPIPSEIHKNNPDFFPDLGVEFTVVTDDGESFVCTVAQQGRKAIHTNHDNSILGKYFRKRLGVPLGERVERCHLDQYGRDFVTLYKLNDNTYFMDFAARRQ